MHLVGYSPIHRFINLPIGIGLCFISGANMNIVQKDDARIDDIQKIDLSTNASTRSPRINNLNENIATACRRPSALW